jgi:uncharacterized membrane protein
VRVTPKAKSGTSVGTHLLTVATVLAGLGVLLTAYLTAIRWFGRHAAYCDAGSSCDAVQASRWSVLLGMPLSLWGFLMYALLIALLWRQRHRPSAWPKAITLAAFGTGMSIYLTAVSFFEIRATCIYCLASLAIITLIFALLAFLRPPNLQRFDWGDWALRTGPGVAVLLVVLHFHFSGLFDPAAGPEKPYLRGLAEHLSANDATFFGAYWCAQCQQQKALFEASTHRLPYVECTPAGQGGPVAIDCVTNRIHSYPTWIIGGHRYERVLTPESLARLSGFKGPGSEPQ